MKLRKKLRVWVVRRFQRCNKPVSKRASAAEVAALDSLSGHDFSRAIRWRKYIRLQPLRLDFSSLDAGSATFKDSTFSWFAIRSSLLTLHPRRLELIARLPSNWLGQTRRLPSQRESKPRHRCIGNEIHPGIILIARLVIMLLDEFLILR